VPQPTLQSVTLPNHATVYVDKQCVFGCQSGLVQAGECITSIFTGSFRSLTRNQVPNPSLPGSRCANLSHQSTTKRTTRSALSR
jgi:hypothetical protein